MPPSQLAQCVTMHWNISSQDELQKKPTCLTSTPSTRLNPRTEKMTIAVHRIHFSPSSPFSYPVNRRHPPLYPVLRFNRRHLHFPTLSLAAVLHPIFRFPSRLNRRTNIYI
uniref:Uncharacterized protein n=1 Tax=Cucumis melo TaxID=3656 RepID=A0A9I9E9B3_CUCME